MTRTELLDKLLVMGKEGWNGDPEENHQEADGLLLKYIGDPEISSAFGAIEKWYS